MLIHYRILLPILKHASPILIHPISFRLSAPYLTTCITYPNTLTRLSAPYLNTCITYLNTSTRLSPPYLNTLNRHDSSRQPIRIEHPRTVGSQSESSITSPESSANQNRALRHPRALG